MFLSGIAVGLIVGWNILPQPAWVQRIYQKVSDRWFSNEDLPGSY